MKKIIFLSLLVGLCCALYASQIIYVSSYTNGTDTVTVTVSPYDGNMYAVVNGRNEIVLSPVGVTILGPVWGNSNFGTFSFTNDYTQLQVYENSSGKYFYFKLFNVEQRIVP